MAKSIIHEKSFHFALEVIELFKKLQAEREYVLSKQLLRSGTSIGANVEEALAGQSRRDFLSKMAVASKEARETRYWLALLQKSNFTKAELTPALAKVDELIRILTSIVKTTAETPATQNSKLKTDVLPDLIEIVPLDKPVRAEITVPGSKSITNRALILAALADGEVKLTGALWSEDTQVMFAALLTSLGFMMKVGQDPNEQCNRNITVMRMADGFMQSGGTEDKPRALYVENAGTAARFLSAFICLGEGVYRLFGSSRMHERPQSALFRALRELGYRVESENGNDRLPAKFFGEGSKNGKCRVNIEESSQFASALLLCAKAGGWEIEVIGENADESPYVEMTKNLIEVFPRLGKFQIELDASSASYIWAAKWLLGLALSDENLKVVGWENMTNWQVDSDFPIILEQLNAAANRRNQVSRKLELGDSIMTAIVLSPLFAEKTQFTELGNLRLQETERVVALRTELTKCGAKVVEEGDTLTVWPSPLHGAEIETYNDHRMAMCFAILGLKVPGIKIKNPACVKKTFPNFFQKLAAQPPHGLGATILDAKAGRKLTHEELFAD